MLTATIQIENDNSYLLDLLQIVAFSALTGLGAQVIVPLPFSPVPVTGQTFFVLLAGMYLGPRKGALSQLVYVMLGALIVPWFAGGTGGIQVLFGATAGYLLGFIIAPLLIRNENPFSLTLATISIYALGITGLLVFGIPAQKVLIIGFFPFLAGDILKIVLVYLIGTKIEIKNSLLIGVTSFLTATFAGFIFYLYSNGSLPPENLPMVSSLVAGISLLAMFGIQFVGKQNTSRER